MLIPVQPSGFTWWHSIITQTHNIRRDLYETILSTTCTYTYFLYRVWGTTAIYKHFNRRRFAFCHCVGCCRHPGSSYRHRSSSPSTKYCESNCINKQNPYKKWLWKHHFYYQKLCLFYRWRRYSSGTYCKIKNRRFFLSEEREPLRDKTGHEYDHRRHVCHRLLPIPCRIRYRLHQSLAHSFSPVRYKGNIALGRPRESMQIGGYY